MALVLRPHQQPHFLKLFQALHGPQRAALDGSDTGTGKTFVGCALVKALRLRTLVVAPLSVTSSWAETLEGFGAEATIINYEKAWRRLGDIVPHGRGSYFKWADNFDLAIFDEVHRASGDTTLNSKMLIAAKRQFGKTLSLSATAADSPTDLKALGFSLGLHGLSDYRDFLLKCKCKPGTFGGWTFNRSKNRDVMMWLNDEIFGIGARGARMRIADIPGFPKTVISVQLLPCVDSQVLKLSEELQGHYNDRAVHAHKMVERAKVEKARQEAAGYEDDGPSGSEMAEITFRRQALETAKIPAIVEMIEDAKDASKVVVFCNYAFTISELSTIATKKGWSWRTIQGGQSPEERKVSVDEFQANRIDVLFCNIQAGGVGVSLHDPVTKYPRTTIICPTFSARDLKQALGRVWRDEGGFSRQYLLYFDKSLEAAIARTVRSKLDSMDTLNDGMLTGLFRAA